MPKNHVSPVGPIQLQFPELIDIKTLARLLGVNERYVRRMVQERRVATVKVGRLVRFDLEEIREWIRQQRRPTIQEQARHRRR